jgi:hypothetical protein
MEVAAAPVHFQSGEKQVALLELYTSEGCSSCPPAEAWLNTLKDSPDLWKTFAPVGFHVDYWDSLGWKDARSSPLFTDRQRSYAGLWRSENVYTPCFVLNGDEWRSWMVRRGVPGPGGDDIGVLVVSSADENHWNVTFVPAKPADEKYEIHAALLAGGSDSDVKAGENRGRHLHHEFAALDLIQIGLATRNGAVHGKFLLDASKHAGETSLALTAWVTRAGEIKPVQATGGWLISPAIQK